MKRATFRAATNILILCATTALYSQGSAPTSRNSSAGPQRPARAERGPERDDPKAREQWERERFGDPRLYAERLLREQERQRALYPAQVPRGRVGEPRLAAPFSGPSWTSLGPTNASFETNGVTLNVVDSGRLQTILPHPTDANTVYVLASGGGLWKTSNFLTSPPTWTPLTDSLLTTGGGAAAFGATPSTIYLGLGDPFDNSPLAGGAMTKSVDGGTTWTTPVKLSNCCFPASASVRDVKVDLGAGTAGQDVVLAASDIGLFRSVDGGTTYGPVLDATTFLALEFWSIAKTSAGWLASSEDDNNGKAGALWLSTDHGATWSAIPNGGGVITDVQRITLGVGVAGDSIVYAFAENGAGTDQKDLFRSTDGGKNWTALGLAGKTPTNPNGDQPNMDIMNGQAFYNQLLLVDPADASRNTVYIGGNLSSAKSTDGGSTWTIISNWLPGGNTGTSTLPYIHADFHAAVFSNISGTKTLFFGTDGGLFVSTDGGTTWNDKKNIGLVTHLHYSLTSNPSSPDSTITGLQDNGTRVRETNTSVFDQTLGGDGFGVGTGQVNALITLGSYTNDAISSSDDLGVDPTHWVPASNGINLADTGFFTEITTPQSTADATGKVFFTTGNHDIYETTDGAATWSSIGHSGAGGISASTTIRNVVHAVGVSPVDTSHIGVAGSSGILLTTANGGASWTEQQLNNLVTGWASSNTNVAWANNSIVYVCSESPTAGAVRVARSSNGGASWSAANTGLPDVQVSRLVVDPGDATGNTVYAGTFIGVYKTTNGGANWSLFGSGLPQTHVFDMYIPPDDSHLRIATYGRGIWEITLKQAAATTTMMASNANPSVFGQAITLTATVTSGSPGTPTGTIAFFDGATSLGAPQNLSSGQATIPVANLSPGSHALTATYSGDSNFAGSTSSGLTQTVTKTNTTTSVLSSSNPSVFGQQVTLTASVTANSPGSGTPSGMVTFMDGAASLGSGNLAAGSATLNTAGLTVGSHSITAVYGGDANFNGDTSATFSQTVNPSSTTTAVSSSVNPTVFGQAVKFTATVSALAPGAGSATGSVTFMDGASSLGTVALSGGAANLTTATLIVATHNVSAVYSGDSNFTTSTSPGFAQTVNKDNTLMGLNSPSPSVFGQPVMFTATMSAIAPGSGIPTGTVTFTDEGAVLGAPALSGSAASLTTAGLAVGSHSITATYNGDAEFNGASNALSQVVSKAATSTSLTSSVNPSTNGQQVTFTANVTAMAPGAGTPTGSVSFMDNGANIGNGTLVAGSATFSTSTLAVGSHPITAIYTGDNSFNGGTSNTVQQIVNPTAGPNADLSVTLQHVPTHPVAIGGMLVETVTVSNAGPNAVSSATLTVNLTGNVASVFAPSCGGIGPITCNLGAIGVNGNVPVIITLTPLLGHQISVSASVNGTLPDNIPSNNTANENVPVRFKPQSR